MPDGILPQPPPGVPAPPPSEAALLSQQKKKWLLRVGVVAIGYLIVMSVFRTCLPDSPGVADGTQAISNARQLGIALFEFETDYGSLPNETTAAQVKLKNPTSPLTLGGGSSNELFAQLFASGICRSESIFYAKTKSAKKTDDIWTSDATTLEHGECAFAFICNLGTAGDPTRPILFGPVIPGTKTLGENAIILKSDNSVTSPTARPNGMDFLDPRQPYWHGKAPDVRWPK